MNIPIQPRLHQRRDEFATANSIYARRGGQRARFRRAGCQKIADVFSDTDGIPDWWRLAYFGHPLGEASDKSRGSDDADGNGISNLTKYLNGINPLIAADVPTPPVFNVTQISVTAIQCPNQLLNGDQLEFPASEPQHA